MCCKSQIMLQLCSNLQQHGSFFIWNLFQHSREHIYKHIYKIQEDWASNMDFIKYAAFQLFCSTIWSKYAEINLFTMSTISYLFYHIKIPLYTSFHALYMICSPNSPIPRTIIRTCSSVSLRRKLTHAVKARTRVYTKNKSLWLRLPSRPQR